MFSLLVVGGAIPMGIVAPLGEWLLLSSRDMLYLAAGPALSILCCFLGGRVNIEAAREPRSGSGRGIRGKNWGTYSRLFSSRPFLFLVLTGTVIALADALIINLALLAADKGLVASYFLVSVSVTAIIVRLPGAALLNVLPRMALLAPCGILISCSMVLVSSFPSNNMFILGGIIFGLGLGAGWPMYHALIADLLEPALLPKGTATALLLYDIGFCVTPLIVGYFLPIFGTAWTFAAIALATGGALVLLQLFYWIPLYQKSPSLRF